MDGDKIIDQRTAEDNNEDPDAESTYWRNKF